MDLVRLLPDEGGLEEDLRAVEALVADGNDDPVGELVGLLLVGALRGCLKDRHAMLSQCVFIQKIKNKQAFPLLVYIRFLFSLSLRWDTCVIF